MTRWTQLFTTLGLAGAIVASAIAACGSKPGSPSAPSEMPPLAPRPDLGDPGTVPIVPSGKTVSEAPRSMQPIAQAAAAAQPASQPIGNAADAGVGGQPSPGGQVDGGTPLPGSPADAGRADSNMPSLPPLPDGGVPVDSRLVPSRD